MIFIFSESLRLIEKSQCSFDAFKSEVPILKGSNTEKVNDITSFPKNNISFSI